MSIEKSTKWHCGGCLIYNKRAASRRVKHPPQTNTTQQKDKPRNRRKSKAAAKIGRRGKPLAHARFFLRRRDPCFFYAAILLSAVLFAPSFLLPYTFRNFAVTLCDVVLLYNPFVTVNATALFFAMWYNRLRLNKHGQSFFDLFTK